MRGPELSAACLRAASNAASAASSRGGHYVANVQVGRNRVHARATTKPGDRAAYFSERRTGALKSARPTL